jgi:hypothetical protein
VTTLSTERDFNMRVMGSILAVAGGLAFLGGGVIVGGLVLAGGVALFVLPQRKRA